MNTAPTTRARYTWMLTVLAGLFTVAATFTSAPVAAATAPSGSAVAAQPISAPAMSAPAAEGCFGPDVLCGVPLPDIPGVMDPSDLLNGPTNIRGIPKGEVVPNPLDGLGDVVGKAAADAWTMAMIAVWNSGLFVLRIVLTFSEWFLTPDLRFGGPGKDVYAVTLWLALSLVVILAVIQLGAAAFKREGKGLARAFIGAGQFVVVCACWLGYCVTIVAACGALSRALMESLLKVQTWPDWDPLDGLSVQVVSDASVATVLAFLGIFLWLAAIGHMLVYLARAASLLILTATGPLSAAGLVSEFTRSWFWKSLRWFHAAAFTPVLMVMVLGIGVQMSSGVAAGMADGAQKSIGTALPAVMLILVSVVAPLALFKMLAFVDPGTPSGASFRQGMAAAGGVQGLLSGGGTTAGSGRGGGSGAAAASDSNGRSEGESSAEDSTGGRFTKAGQGVAASLGPVGAGVAAGMGVVTSMGAKATGLMSDETNQAGVGQNTYGPDFSNMGSTSNRSGGSQNGGRTFGDEDENDEGGGAPPPSPPSAPVPQPAMAPAGAAPAASAPAAQDDRSATAAAPKPASGVAGAGTGAAGGAGAAAAAVPPVA